MRKRLRWKMFKWNKLLGTQLRQQRWEVGEAVFGWNDLWGRERTQKSGMGGMELSHSLN